MSEIPGFGSNFTQHNFTHASYLVISRNFGVKKNSEEIHMMVPMADMFNTEWDYNSHWYYSDLRKGFCVDATKDVAKDEQLLDTYGHKTNAEYLMNYAFILLDKDQNNERDEYPLIVHMDPQDPQKDDKIQIFLEGSEHHWKEFKIRLSVEDTEDFENLLSWTRFITFDGDLQELYKRLEKTHEL